MKLNELGQKIQKLIEEGHGEKQVFTRQLSSGDCNTVSSIRISDEFDDCGPFDIEEGTEYVSISVGH